MPIGDNTVSTIPTAGDDIRWEDIEAWCDQDPITKQWTLKGGYTATEVAGFLNNDFRHYTNCTIDQLSRLLFDDMRVVIRDIGLNPDSGNDNPFPEGFFDTYHRQLPAGGTRNNLLREGWNWMLGNLQATANLQKEFRPVPSYVPQEVQQDDRRQQTGLVLAEWDEVCQDIVEGQFDGLAPYSKWAPYDPNDTTGFKNNPQAVHDAFVVLTGGRRFGACTDTSVNQAITDQNAIEDRNEAFAGTQDVRAKSAAAVEAADAEYRDNPNATRASVNASGDAAYNA